VRAAGAFFAAGLMSFELISYHLSATKTVTEHWKPVFLAISTAFGVIASLVLGKRYDQGGPPVVLVDVFLSALFSPFVVLGGFYVALFGILLWGIGYATQDTLLKAIVAGVLPEGQRNLAFGLYYAGYGVGWLIGSVATGLLYEQSRLALVLFAVAVQRFSADVRDCATTRTEHSLTCFQTRSWFGFRPVSGAPTIRGMSPGP
jgi:predicted MFS family arabinose efflux permease